MTTEIDKRKNYFIVFDTETTNGFDDPLMYDLGFAVVDTKGNVYETFSFVIYEVFCEMKTAMAEAFFADKIPQYEKEIADGTRKLVKLTTAKKIFREICEKYDVVACVAHNATFDYRSTTRTQRYLTKSKYRYFLPFGVELWDTLKMARDTICKQWTYKEWCYNNGYLTKNGRVRATAEILYRYISGEDSFEEEHTGLADVLIEKEIFAHCMAQHKPMRKLAFENKD